MNTYLTIDNVIAAFQAISPTLNVSPGIERRYSLNMSRDHIPRINLTTCKQNTIGESLDNLTTIRILTQKTNPDSIKKPCHISIWYNTDPIDAKLLRKILPRVCVFCRTKKPIENCENCNEQYCGMCGRRGYCPNCLERKQCNWCGCTIHRHPNDHPNFCTCCRLIPLPCYICEDLSGKLCFYNYDCPHDKYQQYFYKTANRCIEQIPILSAYNEVIQIIKRKIRQSTLQGAKSFSRRCK